MPNATSKPSDIAIATIDELLDLIIQDAWSACIIDTTSHRDSLRAIVRDRLLTPFKTNVKEWDQGYDVGRTTGAEEGYERASDGFEKAIEALICAREQFVQGAPYIVHGQTMAHFHIVTTRGGSHVVATCQHESDAQGICELLNSTLESAKKLAEVIG